MGLIRNTPNISAENLTNHLNYFPLKSRAINTEFLNRVQIQKVIIPEEATQTLQEFYNKTAPHPRFNYANNFIRLDEYLLGNTNWKNVPTTAVRERVQRFFIWALEFSPVQKQISWPSRD